MPPRYHFIRGLLCALFALNADAAGLQQINLLNNPFSRPEVLNTPPPAVVAPVVEVVEKLELRVTATMVSKTAPMAVVEGKLLAVGESIEGFRLIAVEEGAAVFRRKGQKISFMIGDSPPTR